MGDQKYSAIYSRLNNIIQETGSDHNLYRFHVMGGRHNKADYSTDSALWDNYTI